MNTHSISPPFVESWFVWLPVSPIHSPSSLVEIVSWMIPSPYTKTRTTVGRVASYSNLLLVFSPILMAKDSFTVTRTSYGTATSFYHSHSFWFSSKMIQCPLMKSWYKRVPVLRVSVWSTLSTFFWHLSYRVPVLISRRQNNDTFDYF